MRPALGYIRVSSEEQAEHGLGLEAQRQRVRAYCEMKGLNLATIYEVRCDVGKRSCDIPHHEHPAGGNDRPGIHPVCSRVIADGPDR